MNPLLLLPAAITAAPEKIPDLKPPRGAIPETLWEQHGWALCVLGAIFLVLLIAIIRQLTRPKPVALPTPADIARRELEALRRSDDPALVNTATARILRGFLIERFQLAGPGLTAGEISANLPMDEMLASNIHFFLHQCDVANFALAAPAPSRDAVIADALGLIDAVVRKTPPPLSPALAVTSRSS